MVDLESIDKKLTLLEEHLERVENKLDNFQGFETLSDEEEKEIKDSINEEKTYSYSEVFDE